MAWTDEAAERDLMLGVLALRTGRVSREELAEALDRARERPLGETLRAREGSGAIDLGLLMEQVEDSWRRHGGDLSRIVPELGSAELAREVAGLAGDPSTRSRMLGALERVYGPAPAPGAAADPFATVAPGAAPAPAPTAPAGEGPGADEFGTVAGPAGEPPTVPLPGDAASPAGAAPGALAGELATQPGTLEARDASGAVGQATEADPFATRVGGGTPDDAERTEADPFATRASGSPTAPFSGGGGTTARIDGLHSGGAFAYDPTYTGSRFRVVRPHARGGLGEVFVALDEQLNREVALKEIQARFADHSESQARFRFEAEVTGGLEHPGIVPVYALGHYPDGRPYYAMRFIRGETLKQAIDRFHQEKASYDPGRRELEFRQLLGRFIDVCQALEYAHSRAVIHRDIKPANIMIGPYGETLVVDWGLAKPLDRSVAGLHESEGAPGPLRPSSGSVMSGTLAGSAVGTPGFMSPEQAEGRLDRLGPSCDIYSLGATLYYLLTGKPAFHERTLPAILDKVRRNDFPPPRVVEPGVPRPLEAICVKAMAREIEERYASARALADDLEHWLADEPVSCYEEPFPARAARWARRHRTFVTSGAAVAGVALLALVVGNVLIRREQARTERNYQLARSAVEQMLTEVGAVDLVDVPQMEGVRRLMLDRALAFYQTFLKDRQRDGALRLETARALVRLGDVEEMLGRYDEAADRYRDALERLRPLAAVASAPADARRALAAALHGRGVLLRKGNRFHEAEASFREALALREPLARENPDDADDARALADTRYFLGALLARQGGSEGAKEVEDAYRGALATLDALPLQPGDTELARRRARYLNNFGRLLWSTGRVAEAEAMFRDSARDLEAASRAAPGAAGLRWQLARLNANLGVLFGVAQRPGEAVSAARRAVELLQGLVADFPGIPDYRRELAVTRTNLAALQLRDQPPDADDARANLEAARDDLERLVRSRPDVPDYRSALANALVSLGNLVASTDPRGSDALFRRALEVETALVERYPQVAEYRAFLGRIRQTFGLALLNRGLAGEARGHLEQAVEQFRRALEIYPDDRQVRAFQREAMTALAIGRAQLGDPAGAAKVAGELSAAQPDDPDARVRAAALLALAIQGTADDEAGRGLVEHYARQALADLREAVARGFRDGVLLDGPDFEPLRRVAGDEFEGIRKRMGD